MHEPGIQILDPRIQNTLRVADNDRVQGASGLPIRSRVRLVVRHGFVASVCEPISPNIGSEPQAE